MLLSNDLMMVDTSASEDVTAANAGVVATRATMMEERILGFVMGRMRGNVPIPRIYSSLD